MGTTPWDLASRLAAPFAGPLGAAGFAVLLDAALKGAVLVVLAAAAARALRHRSAAARHAVWTAAVVAHLALPALALLVPSWRLPLLPTPSWLASGAATGRARPAVRVDGTTRVDPTAATRTAAPPATPGTGVVPTDPVRTEPAASASAQPAAAFGGLRLGGALWLLGTLLVLARLVVGTWRVSRLAGAGERVADGEWLSLTQRLATRLGIGRPLTLLRGDRLGIPVTWGILYPAVLLPPDADAWPEERRRFVLVHEMAHVKRFDALTQLLAQCVVAVFWFDPLVWMAARRMRVEREHACDDYVLREGTTPSLYAGELLAMVQRLGTPAHERAAPAFATLAMARRSEFEGRMLAILDPGLDRDTIERRGTLATVAIVLLLALPLAALRPFADPVTVAEPVRPTSRTIAERITPASPNVSRTAPDSSRRALGAAPRATLAGCDRAAAAVSATTTSLHADDDGNGGRVLEYLVTAPGRCAEALIIGDVRFNEEETGVVAVGARGSASLRERTAETDRSVTITAGPDGRPAYAATRDRRPAQWDDSTRGWLAAILPDVLRESAVDVPSRVARWRARGGVPAVLDAIGRMRSDNAQRAHYEALARGPLTTDEAERAVRQAGRDLAGTASDLTIVLRKLRGRLGTTPAAAGALGEAVGRIASSGDRSDALGRMVHTADRALLLEIAKAAAGITSSGDRAQFLRTAAAPFLTPNDRALREAYFAAAATIPSSGELAGVLMAALPYGHGAPAVTLAALAAAARVTSDGDRTTVLLSAVSQRLVTTSAVREAYLTTARTLGSSAEYRRALDALMTSASP